MENLRKALFNYISVSNRLPKIMRTEAEDEKLNAAKAEIIYPSDLDKETRKAIKNSLCFNDVVTLETLAVRLPDAQCVKCKKYLAPGCQAEEDNPPPWLNVGDHCDIFVPK